MSTRNHRTLVGKAEGVVTIARAMKAENMDVNTISRMTGLHADEIVRL